MTQEDLVPYLGGTLRIAAGQPISGKRTLRPRFSQFDHVGQHRHGRNRAFDGVERWRGALFRGPGAVDVDTEGRECDHIVCEAR